ncbi:Uncharacterised protein [uncultured archaeon]|nr:Uncharacterised protein [uncultured archaeon]
MASIGKYAFLVGVLLAVVLGIIAAAYPSSLTGSSLIVLGVLIILGIVVGLAHITAPHTNELLIAIIALILAIQITIPQINTIIPQVAPLLDTVFPNLMALFAPIALVIGLKQVWALAYAKAK